MTSPRTLLQALIQKLRGSNVSSVAEVDPVAVLRTDPRSEWKPLIPLLRQQLPELLCLDDYDPDHLQGPALWLPSSVDRSLPAAVAAAGQIPVIYLPGVLPALVCRLLKTKAPSLQTQGKCCCSPMVSATTWPRSCRKSWR